MAVPGHDERDYEFARTFGLPIVEVVTSDAGIAEAAYTGPGDDGQLRPVRRPGLGGGAKRAITAWLAERGLARADASPTGCATG